MIEKAPIVRQVDEIEKSATLYSGHDTSQTLQCRGAAQPKSRKRLSSGSSVDNQCQRHVNERTSFFECEARRMWANVSEFQG